MSGVPSRLKSAIAGTPRVVELVQRLHAEAGGYLFGTRDPRLQIFVRHVLEPDFAGSTDVQSKRAERTEFGLGHRVADAAGIVEKRPEDVGVEHELDGIPVACDQPGPRPRNR